MLRPFILTALSTLALVCAPIQNMLSQSSCADYWDHTYEVRKVSGGFDGLTFYANYITQYFDGDTLIGYHTYYKHYSITINYTEGANNTWIQTNYPPTGPGFVREECRKFYSYNPSTQIETMTFDNDLVLNAGYGAVFPPYINCPVQDINYPYLGTRALKSVKNDSSPVLAKGYIEGVGNVGLMCGIGYEGGMNTYSISKQGNFLNLSTSAVDYFSWWPVPQRQVDLAPYFICPNPPCAEPYVPCCSMSLGCVTEDCLGQCSCLGDFDNNGLINIQDLWFFLSLPPSNIFSGDLNGDCQNDFSDLLSFISVYGTFCE